MDLNTDKAIHLAFDAAAVDGDAVPAGLWVRVLGASVSTDRPLQHVGCTTPDDRQLSSLRAYMATAAELAGLLETLAPGDWTSLTPVAGVNVRALVEHL